MNYGTINVFIKHVFNFRVTVQKVPIFGYYRYIKKEKLNNGGLRIYYGLHEVGTAIIVLNIYNMNELR